MTVEMIKEAAANFGTPSYVFDLDLLKERVDLINKYIGKKALCCYAMKANPFIIGPMNEYTDKFEVCSPGAYEICNKMGIAPEKIVVSGVNKTYESMTRIMGLCGGKGIFTIESETHYEILSKVCREQNTCIKVLIRLSSGNQFGVDKETFERILQRIKQDDRIEIQGLHYYSGTQKKQKKIAKEIAMLEEYAEYIKTTYGIILHELEYGPGLSVTYFEGDDEFDPEEELAGFAEILDSVKAYEHITIEMGRFIATPCGYYLSSVVDIKKTEEHNICIIDGGIHQLNYYGQIRGMKKPYMQCISYGKDVKSYSVYGSLCTVNDVLLAAVDFPELSKGDFFAFERCGAYSVTEGMALFLTRELPNVVFYSDKNGLQLVRKEILTDGINSANII